MTWLKNKWTRLCAWAKAEPREDRWIGFLLAAWAFALAMGGGAVLRDGITFRAVISFSGRLLCGCFVWGIWAAVHELIQREQTNLRRAAILVAVLVIFTAFASQINMF